MYAPHQQSQNWHWSMKHLKNSHRSIHIYQGSSLYPYLVSILTFTFIYKHNLTNSLLNTKANTFLIWKKKKNSSNCFQMQHSQSFLRMGNKSHSALISIFMSKSDECTCKYNEILHPGGLLTGKVHNISSCIEYRYYKQVQFIERRKYLASVLYKISASLSQNLMMCLACTHCLILMMHFTCTKNPHWYWWYASLVLHILAHIAHTPYRVHIDKKN